MNKIKQINYSIIQDRISSDLLNFIGKKHEKYWIIDCAKMLNENNNECIFYNIMVDRCRSHGFFAIQITKNPQ